MKTNVMYRHFKGKLYYVHSIARHSETGERVVVYQALYGDMNMYVRPYSMFNDVIDKDREDNITGQTFRFELYKD